jgi:hypothetical protein
MARQCKALHGGRWSRRGKQHDNSPAWAQVQFFNKESVHQMMSRVYGLDLSLGTDPIKVKKCVTAMIANQPWLGTHYHYAFHTTSTYGCSTMETTSQSSSWDPILSRQCAKLSGVL